jgi:hypothetical protein
LARLRTARYPELAEAQVRRLSLHLISTSSGASTVRSDAYLDTKIRETIPGFSVFSTRIGEMANENHAETGQLRYQGRIWDWRKLPKLRPQAVSGTVAENMASVLAMRSGFGIVHH